MRILADENIPYVREAASALGEVQTMPGREMRAEHVRDVDVLFVRSVTRVDEALLAHSAVRFVATATIGTDHVDLDALHRRRIGFSAAPGSNATSVAEYVVAALLYLAVRHGEPLAGRTLGIIGLGNVGSRVAARAEALGLTVLRNDPPLARANADTRYVDRDTLLVGSDIVTMHVPLTKSGHDATYHMIDDTFLKRLGPEGTLINTSRGAVHDSAALLRRPPRALVLDVWEGEPAIDKDLLRRADLATPHIAGYSFDGKVAGTRMIVEAAAAHLDVETGWDPESCLPAVERQTLAPDDWPSREAALLAAVRCAYDIEADDARLRATLDLPTVERPAAFDRLRKTYPVRREFHRTPLALDSDTRWRVGPTLAGLSFRL